MSPTTGERVGLSFIVPRTREELEARREMMLQWARATCGMMGRSPDFMNVSVSAWAGAADYFAQCRPEFGANVRRYHEHIREHDLTLTHALINLQRSRTVSGVLNLEEGTALHVVRETDAGVIVRGARVLATLAPISDEIAVYSPRLAQMGEPHSPFALNFAIPCGTPGLKFLCRESFDLGRSRFDHPARLPLRGDGLRGLLRRRAGAVGARVPARRHQPDQRDGDEHRLLDALGPPGRGQEPRQVRVRPRGGAAHDADAGQRPPAPHRGAAGRADDVHGADAGLPAGLRGRRRARSVGHHAPGARCRWRSRATCSRRPTRG